MSQDQIQSYQPGGSMYAGIQANYGVTAANAAASAALTGDITQVTATLANFQSADASAADGGAIAQGSAVTSGSTSTLDNLTSQLYNDPFTAPIDQASKILNNTITTTNKDTKTTLGNLFSGSFIYVALAVAGIALFFYFGGSAVVRKQIAKHA